jgi:SARP family transcriptional regulator, regulator of embCAB operon
MPPRLEVRLLGPLDVIVDGRHVPLGGVKQRAVLAVLVLRRDEVVSTSALAEAVWGEHVPARPTAILQVYVSNLRRLLDGPTSSEGAASVLVHRAPGYRLVLSDTDVDLSEFDAVAAEGRRAFEQGRFAEASVLLRQALALVRGPLLADLTDLSWFEADRIRVTESGLALTELRVKADLQLGRQAELVEELQRLTVDNPLREGLWELLIVALYRCGRQVDALGTYRRVRRLLQDELGIDPGPALRGLERFVLMQSAELDAEAAGRAYLLWTDAAGRQGLLTLQQSERVVTVGRRSENDLALPWDPQVSRRHATLTFQHGQWHVRDEGSSNGTSLDGAPVTEARPLRHGDVIRFGRTPVVFRWPTAAGRSVGPARDASVRPTVVGR